MIARIRSDILFKIICSGIIVILLAVIPNYQYFIYHALEKLSAEDITAKGVEHCIGYQVADQSYLAGSVKEIEEKEYCMIRVKRSDLKATSYYRVIDEAHSGGSAKYIKSNEVVIFLTNNWETPYGRYYIVTLESGEKIAVLLNQALLTPNLGETITLPLGKVETEYSAKIAENFSNTYGIAEDAQTWYLDMASAEFVSSDAIAFLAVARFIAGVILFIVSYVVLSKLMKKHHIR